MIQILSKFNINDEVYFVEEKNLIKEVNCPLCTGEKYIKDDNATILCPNCKGYPKKLVHYKLWTVNEEKTPIKSMSIRYYNPSSYFIKYSLYGRGKKGMNLLYHNKQEATLYKNRLNKALIREDYINNSFVIKNIEYKKPISIYFSNKFNVGDTVYIYRKDSQTNEYKILSECITQIRITKEEKNTRIKYKVGQYNRAEENIYLSKEEAELGLHNLLN